MWDRPAGRYRRVPIPSAPVCHALSTGSSAHRDSPATRRGARPAARAEMNRGGAEPPWAEGSVTCSRTGIAVIGAGNRQELPVVSGCFERELEDAEHSRSRFTVRVNAHGEVLDALAARADVEFANAARGVDDAVGRHRLEALVILLLAVYHHVHAGGVESAPDRFMA